MNEESRRKLHEQFVLTIAEDCAGGKPVAAHELTRLSRILGTQLPAAYGEFLRRHGTPHRVATNPRPRGADRTELWQLLSPDEVVKKSRALWCELLPVDMFVFGLDNQGNALCFQQRGQPCDDAPVFMWSPKHERLFRLSESFDALLALSATGAPNGVAA